MSSDENPVDGGAQAPLKRVLLRVEYDGTNYKGLQRQRSTDATIQGHLEDVAAQLGTRAPNFIAAGRTDAGVHATGQVVAMDLPAKLELKRIALAFNALLPADIRVRRVAPCPKNFSPRLDAVMRSYVYRLCSRMEVPPLLRHYVSVTPFPLDPELTIAAARAFEGRWEFCQWRSSICQATRTFLTMTEARAIPPMEEAGEGEPVPYWRFVFRARSFVHHQVRFMVGGIVAVGRGRIGLGELKDALANGVRPVKVKCESACGLCLTGVSYPTDPFAYDEENTAR